MQNRAIKNIRLSKMTLPDIHATYLNLGFFARFWSANTTKTPANGVEGTNPRM
jgi:hypothetical protein